MSNITWIIYWISYREIHFYSSNHFFLLYFFSVAALCRGGRRLRRPLPHRRQVHDALLQPRVRGRQHQHQGAARGQGTQQLRRMHAESESIAFPPVMLSRAMVLPRLPAKRGNKGAPVARTCRVSTVLNKLSNGAFASGVGWMIIGYAYAIPMKCLWSFEPFIFWFNALGHSKSFWNVKLFVIFKDYVWP